MAGVGGVMEFDGEFNLQVPLGLVSILEQQKMPYINIQSEYRYSFLEHRNNLQHGIGFIYLLGGKAQDSMKTDVKEMDKKMEEEKLPVVEPEKKCLKTVMAMALRINWTFVRIKKERLTSMVAPTRMATVWLIFKTIARGLKGNKEMKGCPDSDGDGWQTMMMSAPIWLVLHLIEVAHTNQMTNLKTQMEMVFRILLTNVPIRLEKAENGGCPMTDRDMDGVDDSMDKCRMLKGSMAAGGCLIPTTMVWPTQMINALNWPVQLH